jgi:tRNA-specific 2-thiouridylase
MRAVVAMSGGVDSSVAALELKKKGYEVIGITIKTWPKEECGEGGEKLCCSLEAVQFARSVAEDLDIPHYVVDLSKEFADIIKSYFVHEYSRGRTPSPCIYCNSKIKFGYLLTKARELGAEKIATGHYARIIQKGDKYFLQEALDKWQDQSYFLYDISKGTLPFVEFPLGEYSKEDVRQIAMEYGFMTADRESSQDICFASAEGDYRKFLKKSGVEAFEPGDILDTEGKVVGQHDGIASYTVGQRRGLGLARPEPVYVLKIDADRNMIIVGTKEHAMNKKIRVAGFNWLTIEKLDKSKKFDTKLRYGAEKSSALVTPWGEDEAIVEFHQAQFAPTPGQAAVFYEGETVAGGAWIEEVL